MPLRGRYASLETSAMARGRQLSRERGEVGHAKARRAKRSKLAGHRPDLCTDLCTGRGGTDGAEGDADGRHGRYQPADRAQCGQQTPSERPETDVVWLITQRGQGESRRRRSANAELLAPQRNDCRENIQRLGEGWRRGSYLGLDGRDHAPAHLLAEVQVHVPVPL